MSDLALTRLEKLKLFDQLKQEGCSTTTALRAITVGRSTLFNWKKRYREKGLPGLNPGSRKPHHVRKTTWSRALQTRIYLLRKKYPCWGKEKIHRLLVREYGETSVSVSTVGRIIHKLVQLKRIQSVHQLTGKRKAKRKRAFNQHAKRWKYGMKSRLPGELIQIDHMSVNILGKTIKHFKACCPSSKIMIAEVYHSAKSRQAKLFLESLITAFPFKILSIQVDGGSEFMDQFEQACQAFNIRLFILPPRSPQYNGVVERANGVTRDEFYSFYDGLNRLEAIRTALNKYQHLYNHFRPHRSLDNLTPFEYIHSLKQNRALESNMY